MSNQQQFGQWRPISGNSIKPSRCYTVTRDGDENKYALKINYANQKGGIKHEVDVLKRLGGHPNILSLVDYDLDCPTPYHVTHYHSGGSLTNPTFREWTLEQLHPKEVQAILAEVAKGIGYMHSQGVIHRELGIHQIVLTEDNVPVITDFETARIWDGYFPDTENDIFQFGRLYNEVIRNAKGVMIRKRREQDQLRQQEAWEENSQPHPPRQIRTDTFTG